MKNLIILLTLSSLIFIGCNYNQPKTEQKTKMVVSFNKLYTSGKVLVAYTEDTNTLWINEEWANSIKSKMRINREYNIVLLFDSYVHTPLIKEYDVLDWPEEYDKWMVAGYWRYPKSSKFCYGGKDQKGNFKFCQEFE